MKREQYLSWDEYFMGIALLSAQRSKDPGTQSVGYNGMPAGCSDDLMPWDREGAPLETKYLYVCHAELNAILNHGRTGLKGAKLYTTLFPCNECAKAIIQSGIREVVYLQNKYADTDAVTASKRMFQMVGVTLRSYTPGNKQITLDL